MARKALGFVDPTTDPDFVDDLRYVLENAEYAVQLNSGRLPGNRPVLLHPNGRVRIDWLSTFTSMKIARQSIEKTIKIKESALARKTPAS